MVLRSTKGVSLLEIQVSLAVLVLALAQLGHSFLNYSRQLGWLETKRSSYAVVASDRSKIVFAHFLYGGASDPIVNRVEASKLQKISGTLTATVELKTP